MRYEETTFDSVHFNKVAGMKRLLLFSILNLTAVTLADGQGYVWLDNYFSAGPTIAYGQNSGGSLGTGIGDEFTVGLYFGEGVFADSVSADSTGVAVPTALSPLFQLATGPGSTAQAYTVARPVPGYFSASALFQANSVAFAVSTFMVVAYNGASYGTSTIRGHSAAFEVLTTGNPDSIPSLGTYMSGFDVRGVPEPSAMALTALGGLAFMLVRRHR